MLVLTIINNQDRIIIIYNNTKKKSIIYNQRLIINNQTKIWNISNRKWGKLVKFGTPFPLIIKNPFPLIMQNWIMIILNLNSRKWV